MFNAVMLALLVPLSDHSSWLGTPTDVNFHWEIGNLIFCSLWVSLLVPPEAS